MMREKTKESRNQIHRRQQRLKKIAFAGITVVVLGLAAVFLVNAFYKPPLPPVGNVIDVAADMSGFDKSEIHVKVGEPVTLRLRSMDNSMHSDGGGKHQWAVDEFNVSVVAPPEGTAMVTFTPTKTGTFDFYCDICCGGRANPSMNGTLVVEG
jgi:heme/copper-type cytochrome/quinol oxidase subunit 2